MTNKRTTKQALVASAILLCMSFTMLLGTTFAWFTDSVTSSGNIIKTGTLDVEMYWAEGKEDPNTTTAWADASKGPMFNYELWEPGYVAARQIKISNKGTLDFKYKLNIIANGEVTELADVIDVYFIDPATQLADRAAIPAEKKIGTLTEVLAGLSNGNLGANELGAGEDVYVTIALKMQESAGNEYQDLGIGSSFSIQLLATQVASEVDSFDNQYDAEATYPMVSVPAPLPTTGEAANDINLDSGVGGGSVTLPGELVEEITNETGNDVVTFYHDPIKTDGDKIIITNADILKNGKPIDLTDNTTPIPTVFDVNGIYNPGSNVIIEHDGEVIAAATVDANGMVNYAPLHFCDVTITKVDSLPAVIAGGKAYITINEAFANVSDGATVALLNGYNTSANPLTETIVVDKEITLVPNGMYLVSEAPATFTVAEGGKLTVAEGSFTIKNTSANGACVLVDGGEFVMAGGSFDGHTAVRTTEGKSSTVTLAAGWSNRVTVSFDSKGNDTINVTGGSIYSSAEAIKTTAGTHVNINISGGLLSSRTTQYSAAVNLQGTATVNMTGGKIENTYSSGYNGSSAIEVNTAPTTINLSGTAALSSNGVCVMLGSHWDPPAAHEEKIVFNMSGNASVSATSQMGFGIRYAQDNCDVTISGNAKVNATYQAIQFNTNNYVYTNSTLTVSENATITSTAGRIGGGYAIASNGHVTVTGGTISGSTAGIASFQAGAIVVVDNSESETPITINKVNIAEDVTYIVAGNPSIG